MNVPTTESRVGTTTAGRYKILRLLGEGGMGAVYEAEHVVTRRRVALKVMHPGMGWSEVAIARFVREARVSAVIAHPNVVEVFDAGTHDDGTPFMALELLEGESMASRLSRLGTLSVREALRIADAVLDALAVAHAKGVVHRDIKPENIFLMSAERGGGTKVLDFGISKITSAAGGSSEIEDRSLTKTGSVLGTADYMSPEQVRGEDDIDGRTDLWAVGVVLYRSLAGRLPFSGKNYNTVVLSVMTDEVPPLAQVVDGVPVTVSDIVARALSKDRKARWPDAAALRAALRGVLDAPEGSLERARVSSPEVRAAMSTTEQRALASLPTLDSASSGEALAVATVSPKSGTGPVAAVVAPVPRADTLSAQEAPTRERNAAAPRRARAAVAAGVVVLGLAAFALRGQFRGTTAATQPNGAAPVANRPANPPPITPLVAPPGIAEPSATPPSENPLPVAAASASATPAPPLAPPAVAPARPDPAAARGRRNHGGAVAASGSSTAATQQPAAGNAGAAPAGPRAASRPVTSMSGY